MLSAAGAMHSAYITVYWCNLVVIVTLENISLSFSFVNCLLSNNLDG